MLMVSMIQPNISLSVPKEQSPSRNFFMETGSCLVGLSLGKSGSKTLRRRQWNVEVPCEPVDDFSNQDLVRHQ